MNYLHARSERELDDADEDGECTGDPSTCHCKACRVWWNDVRDDRAYDERKEPA